MFLAPFLQNFGVRRMLPYTPPVTQLRDPNESCHVRKSEAAPHPQSPARRRTKHRGASGGHCRVAAMKKWLPPSAHIPALVRYAAVPRPRKPDAGSGCTPQLLSTSPAPRATHGAAAATTARPEVTRCPSSRARPPAPPPPTTTGSTEKLRPPQERRCYLAHAALVLLGHGQEDAIEAILLLRRFLRAQPHPTRHRSPQSPHATANRNRKQAGRKRKSGTSLNIQSPRSAALLPSRIGRDRTRGGEAGRVARGSVAIATAGPGPFQKAPRGRLFPGISCPCTGFGFPNALQSHHAVQRATRPRPSRAKGLRPAVEIGYASPCWLLWASPYPSLLVSLLLCTKSVVPLG